MERKQYDVFISYSRKDYQDEQKNVIPGNEISKIKDALAAANISFWFDEDGIYSGQNFATEIINSIESSRIFVFLSSFNSNNTSWTCKEIATADEFKKPIIPVRIDKTPYHKKVLFRIADLDYIDYYTNPEKGREELVSAIIAHLNHIEEEKKRREEEERRRKELEQKKAEELKKQKELEEERRRKEQEQLINRITLDNTALNNDEAKLELERKNLLIKTERVFDQDKREELQKLIKIGGVIHKKYQEELSALTLQENRDAALRTALKREIEEKDLYISSLKSELEAAQGQESRDTKRPTKWMHIIYGAIISLLVIAGAFLVSSINQRNHLLVQQKRSTERKLVETIDKFKPLSDFAPFIIRSIQIKDKGAKWGDRIQSSNASFLYPKIDYLGFKSGNYVLGINIYAASKKKSQGGNFSYTSEVSIEEGADKSVFPSGWGYEEPGNWPAGTYIIEVWCGGKELAEKSFVIY